MEKKTIKVKRVIGVLSDSGKPYYRERRGTPLLIQQSDTWAICSKDGEPSHLIGENFKVEVLP